MLRSLIYRIIGSQNERVIRQYKLIVNKVNSFADYYNNISDETLQKATSQLKNKVALGATLEEIMPEAFACIKEAAFRAIGQKPFDVQVIGAIALHYGFIAEMLTGEGKTLTATLSAYLNILDEKHVHIITVNPYLAARDAEWMGKIFKKLGVSVGVILPEQSHNEKKAAYACDITYGTNYEIGYDYLRDNMVGRLEDKVIPELSYAIIDEADSVLIDEARTPLLISGQTTQSSDLYSKLLPLMQLLKPAEHILIDEKERNIQITEFGVDVIEEWLKNARLLEADSNLYDSQNISLLHYIDTCLKAHHLYHNNVQYLIKDGQVMIIDESTGRILAGRRWPHLHQAIEAKEGLDVQPESQTLASITFQNFFRLYKKIAGMTGTASTEKEELKEIYGLDVIKIPSHKPMIRKDYADLIFLNKEDKYDAICQDIAKIHATGQPILIGTPSVEESEILSEKLKQLAIPHNVLNAKQHAREAAIISQAGTINAVTISANMAGRGTDIVLGGDINNIAYEQWLEQHMQVIKLGGLHVIGSERNESRRADRQILGRSGRQGDPGSSQFYLSLEDPLIRIFASEKVSMLMRSLGMKPKEHISSPLLDRAINNAQKKVEQYHYGIRKNLLKYDEIANEQRQLVYNERDIVMHIENIPEILKAIIDYVINSWLEIYIPKNVHQEWELEEIESKLKGWQIHTDLQEWLSCQVNPESDKLREYLSKLIDARIREITHDVPENVKLSIWSQSMLQVIDKLWKDHLAMTDHLRQGIHLRSYAQKNPAHEFTRECFDMFYIMLSNAKYHILNNILNLKFQKESNTQRIGSYKIETS